MREDILDYELEAVHGCSLVKWRLGENQNSKPYASRTQAHKSIQCEGIFGGATVTLEGSNSGSGWAILHNNQGNPLIFYGAGIESISEQTRYVRPSSIGGDKITKVILTLLLS